MKNLNDESILWNCITTKWTKKCRIHVHQVYTNTPNVNTKYSSNHVFSDRLLTSKLQKLINIYQRKSKHLEDNRVSLFGMTLLVRRKVSALNFCAGKWTDSMQCLYKGIFKHEGLVDNFFLCIFALCPIFLSTTLTESKVFVKV